MDLFFGGLVLRLDPFQGPPTNPRHEGGDPVRLPGRTRKVRPRLP